MLNAWVSVQEKETLLKAVYNRLKPNGIFAFNTKLNSSVDSIREIATRITGKMDYTDIVPESGREDIEELVSSRFQINAYGEEDLYLTRSEAERYLEEAVIRTKSFGNSWRKRPELKEDNFFWRKEGYFVLEKV